ncbi:MAG: cytochrome c biogenesis protein ResB [Elusimicrobia bacterium]|nr:cytochrome c biogenesis protein ResB [Elusimicrobiota bacterium]
MELTLTLMGLMILLVVFGTLDQVHLGTFAAQKKYFSSWFIFLETESGARFPVFPGGYLVGGMWLVNLAAAHFERFVWSKKRIGISVIHGGLFLLLLGQGLTQMFSVESQMAIDEGTTRNYSEDYRDSELAIIDGSDPAVDRVVAIPASLLAKEETLAPAGLPFAVTVKRFFANAVLRRGGGSLATRGIGTGIAVEEAPPVSSDDDANNVSALVEFKKGADSLGTWLVSTGLGAPQSVAADGREYRLALRPRRHYVPFSIHLKDFTHDVYPGTDIPKNFSSLVRLTDPQTGEDRDALIYMNHPLRYRGLTFFQASFGKGDTMSVLQVVKNPVWVTPYVSCVLVSLGLAIQFLTHLAGFRRKLS